MKPKIEIVGEGRTINNISSGIAERVLRRAREATEVEIILDGPITKLPAAHPVGPGCSRLVGGIG